MKAIRVSAVLAPLALAGCAATPTPVTPPPPPRRIAVPTPPPPAPPPAAPADWRDAPQTPGTWRWAMIAGRSTASYGLPGQAPVARLTCEAPGRSTNLWTNRAAPGPVPLVVTATAARRLLTAAPEAAGGSAVTIPAGDPLLDAMAFSRGRFMVEVAGFPALYLPAWPELSRVIEDCRGS